ncbi:hypothetical protein QIW53_12785 [Pseudomonas fluorescens]|uniref:hypothetical protein n=1 Tax=Pseudomonas fluorescens TaxID=294 RepID=UPI003524BB19
MTAVFLMMSVGGEIPAEPCGSGLAREGVCTFGIDIGWHTAIASKPAPTEIADSAFKPKLKRKQALPYSGRDKQPYSVLPPAIVYNRPVFQSIRRRSPDPSTHERTVAAPQETTASR